MCFCDALPRRITAVVPVEACCILPAGDADVEELATVLLSDTEDNVRDCLGALLDGEVGARATHVRIDPLCVENELFSKRPEYNA